MNGIQLQTVWRKGETANRHFWTHGSSPEQAVELKLLELMLLEG